VNPVDYKVRASAAPPAETAKVIGYDAAGVVVEAGPQASLFRPGDEVFYAGSIIRSGTNAEFHLVDERIVGRKRARSDLPRRRRCRSHRSLRGKPCSTAWTSASRWWVRHPQF
jgi:NADPH:quinone reductase